MLVMMSLNNTLLHSMSLIKDPFLNLYLHNSLPFSPPIIVVIIIIMYIIHDHYLSKNVKGRVRGRRRREKNSNVEGNGKKDE